MIDTRRTKPRAGLAYYSNILFKILILIWLRESQIKGFSSMSWYEHFTVIFVVYSKQWIMCVHEEKRSDLE
jgi:hypothetical protein